MQEQVTLDRRLKQVVDFIPKGSVVADIGSDHAYVPCYLVQQGIVDRAIAGEVNRGPMEAAKAQVALIGATGNIDVRLGDGLAVLKEDEATCISICGMGGSLIRSILESGRDKLGAVERLVLQPNVDGQHVREWLLDAGFVLVAESIVEENDKVYEILVGERGTETCYSMDDTERMWQLMFGPYLLKTRPEAFKLKWGREADKLDYVLGQMAAGAQTEALIRKQEEFKTLRDKMREVSN
ncbi:tRNA (adenine(22)-N(1))-methyltransferase [Exiguobacterium aurantiacum]|uniref:tRNA (Adenine(22)-N(1))-methyltransferase TrmK n=1 Tax=Exiguobacterium aurantiacum TaxID=33987 RepID=A0ABY5FR53_9BACL|nr:tRNA (adenine(22)-N(1))-methyltransferase TrmK [Exiguobacterium aurantiacum]UTT44092.1 tRNA (adenine(22)-N(1))-methyltransferase TrmK [Exiguobacterium aurantiacum]